jgi:hypothetical protein
MYLANRQLTPVRVVTVTVLALTLSACNGAADSNPASVQSTTGATNSTTASASSSGSSGSSGSTSGSSGSTSGSSGSTSGSSGSTSGSSSGTSTSTTPPFYVYQNDDGTGAHGLNKYWDYDYSFGGNANFAPPIYTDKTHPQAGHTYDLLVPVGTAFQPAADNNLAFGIGPFGTNISPYTWMTFDIWTAYPTEVYDSRWNYSGNAASGTADQATPAYIPNILQVPGVGALKAGAWTTVKIPLAYYGNLGMRAAYKFMLRDNTGPVLHEFYLDNVGFLPGNLSWIYDGGAVNGWNSATNTWNWDASAPLNGWADATPAGATANYTFNPSSLTSQLNQGDPSSLNGLVTPGYGSSIVSTKVIKLSTTAADGMWKVANSAGFSLAPYQYLTFGLLPTKSTHSYKVQLYSTSGAPVGNAVDPTQYTNADWGPTGGWWTIYCIPLSAFGSLPSELGGMSIEDTSGLSNNTIYISAVGFFN